MHSRALRFSPWPLLLALLAVVPSIIAPVTAQVAGRNVNMVTGGTFPGGDPFLQKQNEPSIAVSTRNPCHLLAGANDYRAVELPGLPDDQEIGDAWLGWYESTDCGATWYSTLVPGYPQDQSAEGIASPVKGLRAGADPNVRSGAAGTFYYLFIAFNRGSNVGKLALARAIDHNDRDVFINPDTVTIDKDGRNDRRRPMSPIRYVGTTEIAKGSSGQFIDKPSLAVFPAASGTCSMDGETVPATNVYVAWTEFIGNSDNNYRSKLYFARSADCGRSLAGPATKLSEGYPLGQGTAIAVNPTNPNDIYVAWRQIRSERNADGILFARSTDGGRSFTKAEFVPGLGEGQFAPFDQNTTSTARGSRTTTFRTVAYPAVAFGDDGYLYLAVSQVVAGWTGGLGGAQARITMTRTDGAGWEPPVSVFTDGANGQQFMPALAYAAGRLQMIWYDVRFDESGLTGDTLINEAAALAGPRIRRTVDLLGAQASLTAPSAWPPAFQPYGVSQPDYNDAVGGVRPLRGPRVSQYLTGDPTPATVQGAGPRQLQFNRGNLLLYGGGTIPFMGDYIDIGGTPFVFDGATNRWLVNGISNAADSTYGVFHAAWTDNRDAGVGRATTTNGVLDYTRPGILPPNTPIGDVSCRVPGVDNTRTRDANVYTSRITQDFSLTLPTNAKPTNTPGVVRAFPVQLANNLELTPGTVPPETPTRFKLTLSTPGASFSYRTFRGAPHAAPGAPGGCDVAPNESPVQEIFVNVLPRSSVARTVYVRCGAAAAAQVAVTATRMEGALEGPSASVVINPDPSNPGARTPAGDLLGPEAHNPDAENPDAENPDAENPDAENPDAENPDAENPDAENPDAENPDAENPDAENPDAENPDAENPDAENPDAENTNYQDVSADITNDGDTTSAYQVQVQTTESTAGYTFLLMGRRVTSTPTSINCHLVREYRNQTLFAVPLTGADLASGQFAAENDENVKHSTFLVRPRESIRITLRIVAEDGTPAFCSAGSETAPGDCFDKIIIRTRAQAPNTGELEPREDAVGNFSDLVVEGTLAAPASVGRGGFIDVPGTTIRNAGTRTATADGDFSWGYFLSADSILDPASDFAIGTFGSASELAAGATAPFPPQRLTMTFVSREIAITDVALDVAPTSNTAYLGVLADAANVVVETLDSNNALVAPTPITFVPHGAAFTMPESVSAGFPFNVTISTSDGTGGGVPGAPVTLILEGPDAVPGIPGPVNASFVPMNGVTDADGNVTFNVPGLPTGGGYRFVTTIDVPGVGPLKFQSPTFSAFPPIGHE